MLKAFLDSIPSHVKVVAATKYGDSYQLRRLYENGIKDFGEHRVDSFLKKRSDLNNLDITWHFIGHLQKNKAKKVIQEIDFLHSLDSLELAKLIQKYRKQPLKCFIEVSINEEENKNGIKVCEANEFIRSLLEFDKIEVVGLMMMAKQDSSEESLNEQFANLRILKENIENDLQIKIPYLSMGMSDDYKQAISQGATHVRLGRILFNLLIN